MDVRHSHSAPDLFESSVHSCRFHSNSQELSMTIGKNEPLFSDSSLDNIHCRSHPIPLFFSEEPESYSTFNRLTRLDNVALQGIPAFGHPLGPLIT